MSAPEHQAPDQPAASPTENQTQDQAPEAGQEEKLQAEIAELKDQLLRALAEQQNMQRRHQQELANARDYAARDFAYSLLAVKDTLEMVLKDEQSTTEQLKAGVEMTLKNLQAAFERARVREIVSDGAKFDPNFHQAMSQIESDGVPGTVLSTFQKGYLMGDRCLRPAMVAVAKARTETEPSAGSSP